MEDTGTYNWYTFNLRIQNTYLVKLSKLTLQQLICSCGAAGTDDTHHFFLEKRLFFVWLRQRYTSITLYFNSAKKLSSVLI